MSLFAFFHSQPWVDRVGWTLIHFLWQGALIALIYSGIRMAMACSSSNARYRLACAVLALMLVAPLVTWSLLLPQHPVPLQPYRIAITPPSPVADSAVAAAPSAIGFVFSSPAEEHWLPWVVLAWLIGVAIFFIRLAGGWAAAARLWSARIRPAPPEWQDALRSLGARIGLRRPAQLVVSGLAQAPMVVGWLRPVILIPAGALSGLPREYIEALLIHELAHIRRRDYLTNLLQTVAEAFLFYHPAIWWISGHIRAERELCCDDAAVAATGDAYTYACALTEFESHRAGRLTPVLAATGGSLSGRIGRLLGEPRAKSQSGPGMLLAGILLIAAAYASFGQQAPRPAFQVASIKPNTSSDARMMMVRPEAGGRFVAANAPLILMIQNAYHVQAFQVEGGPAWINTDRFDVEAKPESRTDSKTMWLMVQTLLADRFKLALHREQRTMPVYVLTLAKGGVKQMEVKENPCIPTDPDGPPLVPGQGRPCGRVGIMMGSTGLTMQGQKVKMSEFIRMLATMMGRPVVDHTGYTDEFDVHLEFTADENTIGLPGGGGAHDPGGPRIQTDPNRPSILAALPEQLGLKLAAGKEPVDVLVIDHVEKPTAN